MIDTCCKSLFLGSTSICARHNTHTSTHIIHRHTQTDSQHTQHSRQTLSLTHTAHSVRVLRCIGLHASEVGGRGHALRVGALKRRPRVPVPPPALLQKQMCNECLFRYICKHVLIEAMRDLRAAVYGHVCVHADANREPILFNKRIVDTSTTRIAYVCNQEVSPKEKSGCCIAVPYTWRCFLGPCTSLLIAAGGMHTDMV